MSVTRLKIRTKLFLLIGLMVIGFTSLLVMAITRINEVRVGGPLYSTLEAHNGLRHKLAVLRVTLRTRK